MWIYFFNLEDLSLMDTLVASVVALFSLKEPRLSGAIYKYNDPYNLDYYPSVEANLRVTKNLSISYWGGIGFNYFSLNLFKGEFCLSLNPINPDEYSQSIIFTLTKTL